MNWMGIIAELGGVGATGSILVNLLTGYKQATRDQQQFERDQNRKDDQQHWAQKGRLLAQTVIPESASWVVRFLVIGSFSVLSSPVWAPLLFESVCLTWYWPTDGRFLFFSWDKLKVFTVGDPETATRHIAVLPIHMSIMMNIIGYYLPNRIFKR